MIEKIVMSGMRPTGAIHLGHWEGALQSWVKLQEKHPCFYSIVDWHALTTDYQQPENIKIHIKTILHDWLSCGIDPERSTIYVQSSIPEIAELFLLFAMFTPLGWLERVPTFKEQQLQLKDRDINTLGFLGYPLLQTIDIICVGGTIVPVGEDQVFHLELAREIVRRFNHLYGNYFLEPKEFLTPMAKLPGLDGRKMSKSYENAVYISDSRETVENKIKPMITDTRRKRKTDPGVPDDCPVFCFHKAFSSKSRRKEIIQGCTKASIGCLDCKNILIKNLNLFLDPFRERRNHFKEKDLENILNDGKQKTRKIVAQTLLEVKELMKI